jgi:hypothetical protein
MAEALGDRRPRSNPCRSILLVVPISRLRRALHLIRIFAFESCEVDRRHTEKVIRPVVQTIDLKLRLLRRVTGQRRIASTQALYAYVKPVERNVGVGTRVPSQKHAGCDQGEHQMHVR